MNTKTHAIPTPRSFTTAPVSAWLLPAAGARRVAAGLALALTFAALTAVGAQIVIPLAPVPITMQTLFVLLAGAAIGRGWGSLSQAIYVGLGLVGLPLFAGAAAGLAVLAGPTGGYLVSFLVAPFVIGALLRRSDRVAWQVFSFAVGKVVILAMGVAHLTLFYTHDLAQSFAVGVLPFLPGAVFKIAAAVSIHRSSQALIAHHRARR